MRDSPVQALALRIRAWAEGAAAIRALFWFGGYGYGQLIPGSDLDVAVLLAPGAEPAPVAEALVQHLGTRGDRVELQVFDSRAQRFTVWLGEALTKLDVVFGRTAGELVWLADARDVPPPRLTSAWPSREAEVLDLLQRASRPIPATDPVLRREEGEREIDKFLVAFEACSVARARGDAYAFYFQYNLALGRLARLVQLLRVGHLHLYLPRNLFEEALSPDECGVFTALAGTLRLSAASERMRALAGAFLGAVEEARGGLGVGRAPSALNTFLERIQLRDQRLGREHP